jgi:hypothetical protein
MARARPVGVATLSASSDLPIIARLGPVLRPRHCVPARPASWMTLSQRTVYDFTKASSSIGEPLPIGTRPIVTNWSTISWACMMAFTSAFSRSGERWRGGHQCAVRCHLVYSITWSARSRLHLILAKLMAQECGFGCGSDAIPTDIPVGISGQVERVRALPGSVHHGRSDIVTG